jgi:hypothetical protein
MARRALILAVLVAAAGPARAETADPTAELNAERDALIDKITRGVDYDASVKRFAALVKQRDGVVATSAAAVEKERAQKDAERAERDARYKLQKEYHQSADYEVSWRCTLSPDPANPVPSTEGRFKGDWGRVIRKEQIRFPPKNELDEGEPATMLEVKGQARNYVIHADKFSPKRGPVLAEKGDLVMVCNGGEDTDQRLPPTWGPRVLRSGFAVKIAQPPLIAKKARWNPIHVTGTVFFWAIKDVKWKFPPSSFILSNIVIDKDLGGGRYEISAERDLSWILEVPASVKNKDALKPGASVWAIMGNQRFDRGLKKLVLVAEDLEMRYISER